MNKGNLRRCLNNCKKWADDIVIYDDCSTDDSVAVAREYTEHIILGNENKDTVNETSHKQQLLEYSRKLNPDYLMWIDCDEILDRKAVNGGLRGFCEKGGLAYSFQEITFWRGERYARNDNFMKDSWFVRLWKMTSELGFKIENKPHAKLFPINIKNWEKTDIKVLHYGFRNYKDSWIKCGINNYTKEEVLLRVPDNPIISEENLSVYRVPDNWYPEENLPDDKWPEPKPVKIEDIALYNEL